MRKFLLSLLLLAGVATTANLALAGDAENFPNGREPLYHGSHSAASKAASGLQTQGGAALDTLYIGYTPLSKTTANPWAITAKLGSAGGHRPPAAGAMWNWDPAGEGGNGYINGDSLQGWWPIRLQWRYLSQSIAGLAPDYTEPGIALDFGNLTNYYPVNGRTYGVIGAWHGDAGGAAGGTGLAADGVTQANGVTWRPLQGNRSAWCGLRRHGDTQFQDPITKNYFNADAALFNIHIRYSGGVQVPKFPGYVDQWDQMLYRDIDMSGANLTKDLGLSFMYRTRMSNTPDVSGWFDKDPLTTTSDGVTNCAAGNFVSNWDQDYNAPVDSFMVYVGQPVEGTFQPFQSKCASPVARQTIYDPLRRWFGEVVEASAAVDSGAPNFGASGRVIQLISTSSDDSATVNVTLPNAQISSILGASSGKIRLVFRVKTNAQESDISTASYNSNGAGAAQVDKVTYAFSGVASSPAGWGDFEASNAIDNSTTAALAWRSTGKPPQIMTHVSKLGSAGNPYNDLCGSDPVAVGRVCSMSNGIITFGFDDAAHGIVGLIGDPNPFSANHETSNGIMSPTIQFCGPYPNVHGITAPAANNAGDADGTADVLLDYETFTGSATANAPPVGTGITYRWLLQAYPQLTPANHPSNPNSPQWGNLIRSFANYQTDAICFRSLPGITGQEGNIKSLGMYKYTTTAATQTTTALFPDSIKVGWTEESTCYTSGVNACNPQGGLYIDNVSVCVVDGTPLPLSAEIWNFFQTSFPWNESVTPIYAASFDTAGILIKTGLDIGPPDALNSFDVPGDSIVAAAQSSNPVRVDLVFRILPGPGDYVVDGNPASGLALNAQVGNPITGAGRTAINPAGNRLSSNFWESYIGWNGEFGTGNGSGHTGSAIPGKWNPNVWNSARADTTRINIFPRNVGTPVGASWQSTYHEENTDATSTDAFTALSAANEKGARANLALSRHKCFLASDTADPNDIDCVHNPPAVGTGFNLTWVTATGSGYDGNATTTQGTKIIPDGLLTPGAHVEYFWRKAELVSGVVTLVGLMPDTNIVVPQVGERNNDGHRWCGFGALPDRWKQPTFTHPLGLVLGNPACILAINDQTTNGSDWQQWTGVADTIGATSNQKWGAEIGSHAKGNGADINVAANNYDRGHASGFPAEHAGNPGTTWDGYQITGAEDTGPAGSFGARYAHSDGGNSQINDKRQQGAPTLEQLKAFYKVILWFTGNLNAFTMGPSGTRGSDDQQLIKDWLVSGSPASPNRAFWASGDGFVESNEKEADLSAQPDLDANWLGVGLVNGQYRLESGNAKTTSYFKPVAGNALALWGTDGPGWTPPQTIGSVDRTVYPLRNTCTHSNDVLKVSGGGVVSEVFTTYEDPNPADAITYPSSILKKHTAAKPWISLVDGMGLMDVIGRTGYYYKVLARVFGGVCPTVGSPAIPLDVPNLSEGNMLVDFVNLRNNPLSLGFARIHFGLAKDDRVQIKVYDVTGREVRELADRAFKAGEHDIVWDGADNSGHLVAKGVYFTQVRYRESAFVDAKKLTVLK